MKIGKKDLMCIAESGLLMVWIVLLINGIKHNETILILMSLAMIILISVSISIYFAEKKKTNG
jgi:hypothetical protein